MWVCPASPLSTRRYEYIEYENGKLLGEKKYCSLGTSKVRFEEFYHKNIVTFRLFKFHRLTHGGAIFSGIAVIAFVFATNRAKNLIVIST